MYLSSRKNMEATVAFNRQSDVVSRLYTGALQHKAAAGQRKKILFLTLVTCAKLALTLCIECV